MHRENEEKKKRFPLWYLQVTPLKAGLVVKEGVGEQPLTEEEVRLRLNREGVTAKINERALSEALRTLLPGEYILAEGIPPIPGKEGWVEWFVQTEEEHRFLEENGKVNYLEFFRIPSVAAGEKIALIHPAISGKEGVDVRGKAISPPPVKEARVVLGAGVALNEEEGLVQSLKNGLLKVRKKAGGYHVAVTPTLIQPGDVDLSTGNLRFRGDIQINGSIMEGMTVEADGDVRVSGNVTNATIRAGGSILVQGQVIRSRLFAGVSPYQEFLKKFQSVAEGLEKVSIGLHQMSQMPQGKWITNKEGHTIKPAIHLLVQKMTPELPKIIEALEKERKKLTLSKEMADAIERMGRLQGSEAASMEEKITYDSFIAFVRSLERIVQSSPSEEEKEISVICNGILNSHIQSNGDVEITHRGSYHSVILAKGEVKGKGSVRGGEIEAGERIDLEEVGSMAGIKTLLRLRHPQGTIRLGKAFPETEVQISLLKHAFQKEEGKILIFIQEGDLKISRG